MAEQSIPGYRLVAKLGSGGMGEVFKAVQEKSGRTVALKILFPHLASDPHFMDRYNREVRAALELNHPNIVRGVEAGTAGKLCYYAMEFVPGEPLSAVIRREGRLGEDRSIRIALQVARALQYLHERGYVHRDIKPQNILVTADGVAKLADLGLARYSGDMTVTATGVTVGSPHYMAPEMAEGQKAIDIRADIYSLGVTLYHMLVGETPYKGEALSVVLFKHIKEPVPNPRLKRPDLSVAITSVIFKCMEKDRKRRYQTPAELVHDLERLLQGKRPSQVGVRPGRTTTARTLAKAKRGSRAGVWIASVSVLAAVLVLVWTLGGSPAPPPKDEFGGLKREIEALLANQEFARAYAKLEAARGRFPQAEQEASAVEAQAERATQALLEAVGSLPTDEAVRRIEAFMPKVQGLGNLYNTLVSRVAELRRPREDPIKTAREKAQRLDLEGAIEVLTRALANVPDQPEWLAERAMLHVYRGRYEEARVDADRAMQIRPNIPRALIVRAFLAYLSGNSTEAMRDIDAALEAEPDNVDALEFRAMLHLRSGDFAAAARDAEKAAGIGRRLESYQLAGRARLMARDYEAARSHFDAALKLRPDAESLVEIGRLWIRRRDFARARQAFHEALRLTPSNPIAQEGLVETELLEANPPGSVLRFVQHLKLWARSPEWTVTDNGDLNVSLKPRSRSYIASAAPGDFYTISFRPSFSVESGRVRAANIVLAFRAFDRSLGWVWELRDNSVRGGVAVVSGAGTTVGDAAVEVTPQELQAGLMEVCIDASGLAVRLNQKDLLKLSEPELHRTFARLDDRRIQYRLEDSWHGVGLIVYSGDATVKATFADFHLRVGN